MTEHLTAVGNEIGNNCIVLGNGEHDAKDDYTFSAFVVGFPHAIRATMTNVECDVLRGLLMRAAHENKLAINGEILSTSE